MDEITTFVVAALIFAAKTLVAIIVYLIFIVVLGGVIKILFALSGWVSRRID